MLVKLLSRQIPDYEDVINDGLEKTLPGFQVGAKADLYRDLLVDTAQCWLLHRDGGYKGVFITRIEEHNELGGKILTLISGYAPDGMGGSGAVLEGFETMKKFALANGCDRIAFYTDNPEVEKYLTMFPVIWKTKYYQLDLGV